MKKVLLVCTLTFVSIFSFAQSKLSAKVGAVSKTDTTKKDSIIQPTTFTPLLSYADIHYLHDSVLAEMPYKYAPVVDEIFKWLDLRFQLRANEYVEKQKKK